MEDHDNAMTSKHHSYTCISPLPLCKTQTHQIPPPQPTTTRQPSCGGGGLGRRWGPLGRVQKQQLSSGTLKQRRLFLLLQSCHSISNLYQIHAQIILHGFSHKSSLVHKLLSCCVACGDLTHASLEFQHTRNPSTTVWNQMIRGFSKSPTPGESLLLYNRLTRVGPREEDGVPRPNAFTYSFLLNACSNGRLPREGKQLHCKIVRTGFVSSVYVQTSLINMYAAVGGVREGGGAMRSARRVFDDMPRRNVATWNSVLAGYVRSGDVGEAMRVFDGMPERDAVSWTTVIAGCARMGRSRRALALFRGMQDVGVVADQVTMVAALSACADLGDLELGRRIHSWADKRRHRRMVNLDNSLVNMYVKCGEVDEAYRIFQQMRKRSIVSWSTMIMGFVMHGRCEQALMVFSRMQHCTRGGERPDEVTFLGVLCAYGQMGKPDEGLHYFNHMMRTCNIHPTIEHYGCVADMLSRAGRVGEALKLVEREMPMKPNEVIWGALLNGCRIHGDLRLASHVGNMLLELNPPGPDLGGQLAQLSNLYAASRKWDEALWLRRRMVEMRVSKPGGRSWVLVHGVVHEFMAGDQTRQCDPVVYSMVKEIVERAKQAGHIPHISQVLLDVEEEDREHFLHIHSEKLAIAFGLVSIADARMPVRIVTNLCVCSDCHSVAEYVSGSFKRDIIVRERNRFHHFSGGTCSCKA